MHPSVYKGLQGHTCIDMRLSDGGQVDDKSMHHMFMYQHTISLSSGMPTYHLMPYRGPICHSWGGQGGRGVLQLVALYLKNFSAKCQALTFSTVRFPLYGERNLHVVYAHQDGESMLGKVNLFPVRQDV